VTGARFRWPVRVYYEDTDAAGIVYHASYLKFMERARTEWLRSRGFQQRELAREQRVLFVVSRLDIRYLHPARLDEHLDVELHVTRHGRAGFDLHQRVLFVVSRLDIRYLHPARLDEHLDVELHVTRHGRAGFALHQRVLRDGGGALCAADVRVACLDSARLRPCAIPPNLLSELRRED